MSNHQDEHMSEHQGSGNGNEEGAQEQGGGVWTAEPTGEMSHAEHEQELRDAFAGFTREHDDAPTAHVGEHVRPHREPSDETQPDARGPSVEAASTRAGNGHGTADQTLAVTPAAAPARALPAPVSEVLSVAADARGVLDGVAQNLRTLAGHDKHDGAPIAMFPRGIELLEVRMHISRDRDVDLNFRVTGSAPPSPSN